MMKKRTVALLLALVLVFGAVVGGTVAYLIDQTAAVKNTFTPGDVDIDLTETERTYEIIPGHTVSKDPKVTVMANSEDCYVFVKIDKANDFDTFMTYEIADGWTLVPGETAVYYRTVASSTSAQNFSVLKGDQVKVKAEVTKAQLDGLTESTYPTLTFKAYAIQQKKTESTAFSVQDAWAECKKLG